LLPVFSNCNKLMDAGEPEALTSDQIFSDDSLALGGLVGIYYQMMREPGSLLNGGTSVLAGLSADELTPAQIGKDVDFFLNALQADNSILQDTLWNKGYRYVFYCNTMLEGLSKPNSITPALRERIIGEAKCLRAFCYYYLTQLFGDVPLVTSTAAKDNATLPRMPVATIYQELVKDLEEAMAVLDDNHSNAFVGQSACSALLARIYLHLGDWEKALVYSTAVILSGRFQLEPKLKNVFTVASKEVILQLEPAAYPYNAAEGYFFQAPLSGMEPRYTLSKGLINSFDPADERKKEWIQSIPVNGIEYHLPTKYRIATATSSANEYNVVLRLAEQYLIRAEALARLNNLQGAYKNINVIRMRAGLVELTATDSQADCLQAIETERRHELFTEWGHRWIDLKRTGRIDAIMSAKWLHWKSELQVFPIPAMEVTRNPGLKQNAGY
jgi:hypothetical protein